MLDRNLILAQARIVVVVLVLRAVGAHKVNLCRKTNECRTLSLLSAGSGLYAE